MDNENFSIFHSHIWKSKVNYKNKKKLIKSLENSFFDNRNKLTPTWDCFVHSSITNWQEQSLIPEDLLDIIQEKIRDFLNDCPEGLKIKGNYVLTEIWYNIYEKNYFQEPHDHGNSLFSGCYYLKFNKQKHHQTKFLNPNFDIDFSKLEENSFFCFEPDCDEDDIIIFPSSLKHGTMGLKDKNDDEIRITISFNIHNHDLCFRDVSKEKQISYS